MRGTTPRRRLALPAGLGIALVAALVAGAVLARPVGHPVAAPSLAASSPVALPTARVSAALPVTLAEIAADPFRLDGQLVRVRAAYVPPQSRPMCSWHTADPPVFLHEYRPMLTNWTLRDGGIELGVMEALPGGRGYAGGTAFAPPNAPGHVVELEGRIKAIWVRGRCDPSHYRFRSAFLAVDPDELPWR